MTEARNAVKLRKGLFITGWRAVAGRKNGCIEAWNNPQSVKNKQHILVRRRWADTNLECFPGYNMLVRWIYHPLYGAPEFGARKPSPYFVVVRFQLTSTPLYVSLSTPEVIPFLPPVVSAGETFASYAYAQILWTLVLPSHF